MALFASYCLYPATRGSKAGFGPSDVTKVLVSDPYANKFYPSEPPGNFFGIRHC